MDKPNRSDIASIIFYIKIEEKKAPDFIHQALKGSFESSNSQSRINMLAEGFLDYSESTSIISSIEQPLKYPIILTSNSLGKTISDPVNSPKLNCSDIRP